MESSVLFSLSASCFLMEQEIEGSEEETGMANQGQLFAEGIEGMPSMLLCTRENIKTDKMR